MKMKVLVEVEMEEAEAEVEKAGKVKECGNHPLSLEGDSSYLSTHYSPFWSCDGSTLLQRGNW